MGKPADAPLVKPIAGILAWSVEGIDEACEALSNTLGPIDATTEARPWTLSDYYRAEMGAEIWRRYVGFRDLAGADRLAAWKLETNRLEQRWCTNGARRVNLDPGYVDLHRVVLATTKDAAHRIYVGGGIFAEVTLRFSDGSFRAWPHTYPDYAAADAIDFFNSVRARYLEQRRALPRRGPSGD